MSKTAKIILFIISFFLLFLIVFSVLKYGIGVTAYTDPSQVFHPGKTLWDWLELLIVPGLLAYIAWNFTEAQKSKEIEISTMQYRESILKDYVKELSTYIRDGAIYNTEDKNLIETVRINTLNTLGVLDGTQKGQLIHFLHDAKLIGWKDTYENGDKEIKPIIILRDADLSRITLSGTYSLDLKSETVEESRPYFNVNLNGIDFSYTNLSRADLRETQILNGDFTCTNLEFANFDSCEIENCTFEYAKMARTSFSNLICSNCNFENAQLVKSKLNRSKFYSSSFLMASFISADLSDSELVNCRFNGDYGVPCNSQGLYYPRAHFSKPILKNTSFLYSDILPSQIKKGRLIHNVILPNNLQMNKFGLFSIKQEFLYINPAHPGMLVPTCTYTCPCKQSFYPDDQALFASDPIDFGKKNGVWIASLEHIKQDHFEIYKKYFKGIENENLPPDFIPPDFHLPPIID